MGKLSVKLMDDSDYNELVFSKSNHQGSRWKKANIVIPKGTPKGYKVSEFLLQFSIALLIYAFQVLAIIARSLVGLCVDHM